MLVYAPNIGPRLRYILNFFSQYYRHPFSITSDADEFRSSAGAKLNYSPERSSEEEIWIQPHFLLSETFIKPVTVECFGTGRYKAFFRTDGDYPFDIFSACFYLLSRYEEYYQHQKDEYGRYAHQNSLAFREGFLDQPLVNIWLEDFRKFITDRFSMKLESPVFIFQPTYDIDIAWSYLNKGLIRSAGGFIRAFINGEWKEVKDRFSVFRKKKKDPYDSYEWIESIHRKYNIKGIYFFHAGLRKNLYDKNIPVKNRKWQRLVRSLSRQGIGLHPSWASGDESSLIVREKKIIEDIIGRTVHSSRQHYIRFNLPQTYRDLLHAGITDDYSMGYGSINGFRASIASSFAWYDLVKEEETKLVVHPFCFMDATSFFEQKMTAQEAYEEMYRYYLAVKQVNGKLISIWHNTFLGRDPLFEGWRQVYGKFISSVCSR